MVIWTLRSFNDVPYGIKLIAYCIELHIYVRLTLPNNFAEL